MAALLEPESFQKAEQNCQSVIKVEELSSLFSLLCEAIEPAAAKPSRKMEPCQLLHHDKERLVKISGNNAHRNKTESSLSSY